MMIQIKILSYKSPQRYAVRRTLTAAQYELQKTCPELSVEVREVIQLPEIFAYTPVIILPSLVVNEKLVCVGRFPRKGEVITWLKEAMTRQD